MNWKKWIILVVGLIISNSAFGLDTLSITSDFRKVDMKLVSDVFWCNNDEASIERVEALKKEIFAPLTETGVSFPASDEVYWVKTIIKNETTKTRRFILKVDNPRINKLQFFTIKDSITKSSILMGDNLPFHHRKIKNRNFLYPITLKSNQTIEIYIYANKAGESMNLFMSFWDKSFFEKRDKEEVTFWGFYTGFSFCICLTVLLVAIFTRLKLLVYFTIYCVAITLNIVSWIGLGYQYIWSNFPYFSGVSGYAFLAIYSISLLAITRIYLETATIFPRIDKVLLAHQVGIILLFPALILHDLLPEFIIAIMISVGNLVILSYLIVIIIATIMTYWKTKETSKLFFLLGFFFFMIGFWIHMSTSLNVMESNFWTRYGAGVGWILDLIILMIVFSNQIRQSFLKNIQLKQELNESKLTAANALIAGQIEERQRLSSELHDGISIQMALMKMRLDDFFVNKTTKEKEIINAINNISSDIRNFTHAISPFNLNTQTLEDAIEDLIYNIENQTDLEIDFDANNFDEKLLADSQKHSLFQTLQELFNNTIKYALATKVLVKLHSEGKNIELSFFDNGQGFNINTVKKGIGLNNIQARADLLNGNFEINSNEHGSQFEFSFEI